MMTRATRSPDAPTYALISLGCPKNLVDSECMAGRLQLEGYRLVREPDGADFAVVNTCGFIGDAREESYRAIEEMLALRRRGRLGGVIVAGCLSQRDKERLLERFPDVDQVLGVFARDEIAAAAGRILRGGCPSSCSNKSGTVPFLGQRDSPIFADTKIGTVPIEQRTVFRPVPSRPPADDRRLRITPRHLAFLKIAEGCNRLCGFCTIPQIRGPYQSKPIDQVVAEAETLARDGTRELILVAQDTSFYGIDLGGRPLLAELLRQLDCIDGLAWIRLMYLYPMHITDELLEVIAGGRRILPYLDLPLQHISDEVLERMRRRVTRAETEALLDRLRAAIPGLALRTTLIAGFPGETEEQFAELLEFVRQRRFERLGAFVYSDEPGTPAEELEDKLPEPVKQARRDALLAAQQEIAFAWNRAQVGRRLDVLIDSDIAGEKDACMGRTWADAPEIDGAVYVTGRGLRPGQIVSCEIVAARDYDLIGVADT